MKAALLSNKGKKNPYLNSVIEWKLFFFLVEETPQKEKRKKKKKKEKEKEKGMALPER